MLGRVVEDALNIVAAFRSLESARAVKPLEMTQAAAGSDAPTTGVDEPREIPSHDGISRSDNTNHGLSTVERVSTHHGGLVCKVHAPSPAERMLRA
jgi:hypothetical protein